MFIMFYVNKKTFVYLGVSTHPKKTTTVIKITNRQKNNDTSRTNGTFGFARHTSRPFAKPKEPLFANAPTEQMINSINL